MNTPENYSIDEYTREVMSFDELVDMRLRNMSQEHKRTICKNYTSKSSIAEDVMLDLARVSNLMLQIYSGMRPSDKDSMFLWETLQIWRQKGAQVHRELVKEVESIVRAQQENQ